MTGSDVRVRTLIMGAGLCGLSAGYHLELAGDADYLLVERNHEVGGLARTETYDGFSFDHSIHILYTDDRYAADLITQDLLAENLLRQQRRSFCFSHGVFTEYPYQINNYGLPTDVVVDNILGLIEAHEAATSAPPPRNYEEWIYRTFGRGFAENFMIPYNRRQWAWDLSLMNFDWVADRVPMPRIDEVIRGAIESPRQKFGPNREFWYPREGGIEPLALALAARIDRGRVKLSTSVSGIDLQGHKATLSDGTVISYERAISTLPVPMLTSLFTPEAPNEVKERAGALHNNIVHTVNIGLEGEDLAIPELMHWVYFPHDETLFHRISFPSEFSSWMAPSGCRSIQAEISESPYKSLDGVDIVAETMDGLVRSGLLTEAEALPTGQGGRVRVAEVVTLDPAYVIYDLEHDANTKWLKDWLDEHDVQTKGRFGEWEYFNMDHAILSGRAAALGLAESAT